MNGFRSSSCITCLVCPKYLVKPHLIYYQSGNHTFTPSISDLSHSQHGLSNQFQHHAQQQHGLYSPYNYSFANTPTNHNSFTLLTGTSGHGSSTSLSAKTSRQHALRKANSTSIIPSLRPLATKDKNNGSSGGQSIKGFEKQKIRNKFLFFLKRTQAVNNPVAAGAGGIRDVAGSGSRLTGRCGHNASGNKNLASTSSLQRLQQSMDNSESIEICDFASSSPDLVHHKSPFAKGSYQQQLRDADGSGRQHQFDKDDFDADYGIYRSRKGDYHNPDADSNDESSATGIAGRRLRERREDRDRYRTQSGCCRWLGCFGLMRSQLRQFMARKRIEYGVRMYEKQNYIGAMKIWKSLIKSVNSPSSNRSDFDGDDLFLLLGYLYQASVNFGKFFDALEYAKMQLNLSEEYNLTKWRSDSYLNLSLACEKLGKLKKSLSYARHSLYNECDRKSCLNIGIVYLTVARVYLEMGGFSRSLEDLLNSYRIAVQIKDIGLELKCYLALSELFDRLHDTGKAVKYASKSYDLSRSLQLNNLNTLDHRQSLLRMASSLRKNGEFGDAQDYCNEAIRLALLADDQATYIRSLRIMGDVYRKNRKGSNYLSVAFQQYEQSMGLASMIGDRIGQMEAMDGAARCLEILRLEKKICNCRPLEFNTRLLEVANTIGSKLLVRKIRARLSLIYLSLGDDEHHKLHRRLANQTDIALGMVCGVCNEKLGQESNSLEVLPCSHIFHEHCAAEIYQHNQMNGTISSQWKRSSLDFFQQQQRNHHQVYNCPACTVKIKPKKAPKKKGKKKSPSRSSPPTPPLAPLHARHCSRSRHGTLSRQHSLPNCQNLGFDDYNEENDSVELNVDHLIDLGGHLNDDDEGEELIGGEENEDNDEELLLGLHDLKGDFYYENQPQKHVGNNFEDELDVKLRELDQQHRDSMYHQQHPRMANPAVLRNFCGEGLSYENGKWMR